MWLWQNKEVTDAIQKVAAAYDCKIVEGVLSHQLKQFVIDGNKVVLSVPSGETRVDDAEFEENEVYAVDIVISSGDGKVSLDMNAWCFSPVWFCNWLSLILWPLYNPWKKKKLLQPRLLDERQTTIYKRAVDKNYHLKMKSSRFIFSEINQKFPIMPFTARYTGLFTISKGLHLSLNLNYCFSDLALYHSVFLIGLWKRRGLVWV